MHNTEKIINLIFEHWDKIIILLGVIGFFIRELYKMHLKKLEIKFSYCYNKLTTSIQEYTNAYFNYKKAMKNLPLIFFEKVDNAKELDNLTTSYLNELQRCDCIISLYLDSDLYEKYNVITKESEILYSALSILVGNKGLDFQEKINKYDEALREYDEKIKKIIFDAFNFTRKKIQ